MTKIRHGWTTPRLPQRQDSLMNEDDLRQEVEDLRDALRWALVYIETFGMGIALPRDGEEYEDYSGATRLAWPDEPENWS